MALQQDFDFKGLTCDYWRIISVSSVDGQTMAELALYASKEVREQRPDAIIERRFYSFAGWDLTRAQIYVLLKEQEQFQNAIDV